MKLFHLSSVQSVTQKLRVHDFHAFFVGHLRKELRFGNVCPHNCLQNRAIYYDKLDMNAVIGHQNSVFLL